MAGVMVYPRAVLHIKRHAGRRSYIINGKSRIGSQFPVVRGRAGEAVSRRLLLSEYVRFLYFLNYLKQSGPSGNPVGLESPGKPRRQIVLFSPARVRHNKIGIKWVQYPRSTHSTEA